MNATSPFEIIRRDPALSLGGQFISAYLAANSGTGAQVAGTETAPRGLALGAHATDENQLAPAGPKNFLGFLTRRVVVGGLSLADRVFGVTSATPVGTESPFTDGLEVTAELAKTVEAEGTSYLLTSGTGALTTSTAVGALISFAPDNSGRFYAAQAGDNTFFTVSANNLTSSDGTSLRMRFERV